VAALHELFERIWTHAVAVSHADVDTVNAERKQLIELLQFGQTDEYVARHLGVSLRTVRRRVADLLKELGAATRFQAGMEAVRRGWA
jgi:DNA-binding NarL/FixJ family response regulator